MFLKNQVFKKLLKEAYKGQGLYVGHMEEDEEGENEGYYLSGGYWIIWLLKETIPKEAKAAIIELVGDLPEAGEVFRAMKDNPIQYEIEQSDFYNLPKNFEKCKCEFKVSKMTMQQNFKIVRLLQEPTTNHIIALNDILLELVDPMECDFEKGEYEPEGPVAECPESNFIYWGNNTCYLMAGIRKFEGETESEFIDYLEGTTLL